MAAALPPFAGSGDIENLVEGEVTDGDRADALLAAASTLVRAHTGSAWVDADGALEWNEATDEKLKLVGDAIAQVTAASAARAYANPKGVVAETTGPFSIQRGQEAAAGVYLTETEQETLAKAVALHRGATSPGLWTLATTRSDGCRTDLPGTTCDPATGDLYLETTTGAPIPFVAGDQFG